MTAGSLEGKRFLFVSSYWAPEVTGSAPYVTQVAEHLHATGADVRALTNFPHYPAWKATRDVDADHDRRLGVRRVAVRVPSEPTLRGRVLYEGGFLAKASAAGRSERYDAVVACMPTLGAGLAARYLARRRDVPLVVIVHDLMSLAARQSGYEGAGRLSSALGAAEAAVFRAADLLLPCSEAFVPLLLQAGASPADIELVRPWAKDPDPAPEADRHARDAMRARLGWNGYRVLVHTGNMGHKQGLDELVPSLERLEHVDEKALTVFFGDGNQAAALRHATAHLRRTELHPLLPEGDYLAALRAADVCLVHERSSTSTMSLPSKMSSYLSAGQPVLAVVRDDGATSREMSLSGAGEVVPHLNPEAFVAAWDRLNQPGAREHHGAAGKRYVEEALSARSALASIEQRISDIVA